MAQPACAHCCGPPARGDPAHPRLAPAPWRDDPDAAWLIGSNEADGVQWFRKEDHARFVWWSALPALLARAAGRPEAPSPDAIEAWVADRLAEGETTQWRFDALLQAGALAPVPAAAAGAPEPPRAGRD